MSEFLNAALYELCGSELFWNDSNLERVTPELTSCFLNTLPVWIPCGFLWMVAIPYIVYLVKNRRPSLPFTCLSVSKMALAFALLCLADLHFTFQQMYGNHCAGLEVVQLSVQVAVGVRLATYMLVIIILHVQRKFGCKTSGVTYTFWILQICGETFSIYAYSLDKTQCQTHVVFYMYYAVIWLQFLIHSFAEKGSTTGRHGKEPCPLDNGSILNRLTYCWMGKTIHSIYKKTFQRDQMWAQSEILKASIIGPALEKAWKKEQSKLRQRKTTIKRFSVKLTDVEETIEQTSFTATMSDSSEKTPLLKRVGDVRDEVKRSEKRPSANLLKVLMKTYAFDITEFVVYSFLSLLTYFLQPLILRYLLDFIDKKNSPGSDPAPKTWEGVVYCICMVVIIQVCAVFYNTVLFHTATLGLRIKHSLMYLIYKKALTVSKSENNISVGEVVNHMSIDCVRLQDAVFFSYYVPNAILFAIISAYMLYESVGGPATAAGMAFSLLYIPVNSYIVRIQNKLQNELLHLKGLRVRLMNEILCGVKVLKMYAWEYTFIKKVDEVRVREIRLLKKNAYLMAIGTSLANHSQFLIHFTIILVYVLLKDGHYISSSTAFVSLSIIAILKYPLTVLPYLLNTLVQAYVSTKRIQDFLSCSDLDEIESIFVKSADYAIYVRDGVFTWDTSDRKPDLPNINLKIPQRQLIAVVGNCGAGKSSLVSALLGEMRKLDGVLEIKGTVAYVPQQAWIQNMSLRDNILFGKDYSHNWYWKVIDNCCLRSDLDMLADGDNTELGEKGTNISGGQKQRISVARAVYSNADVYILDDPLSAVDAHVGKDLFENVIGNSGMLKNKTRILVTHAVHWLPLVDNIIVMDGGKISEYGTYDQLMTRNGVFAQFLLQHLENEASQEDLDDPEIKWIRDNMLEQVEIVTSEGGNSEVSDSPSTSARLKKSRKKRLRRRQLSSMSVTQSQVMQDKTHVSMATNKQQGLVSDETIQEGSVKPKVTKDYLKAMGVFWVIISMATMLLYHVVSVYSMFWLTYWTEDPFLRNQSNVVEQEYSQASIFYLIIYAVMGLVQGVAIFVGYYLSLTKIIQASSVFHNRMLYSVLRSPMAFFDTVPVGRILNRFSSDVDMLDNRFPDIFRMWIYNALTTVAGVIVIIVCAPIFAAVIIPTIIIIGFMLHYYMPTARKLRRFEAVTRSPIFNHLSETLTGSTVIRSYRCNSRFVKEAANRIDTNSAFFFGANNGNRWISIRLQLFGNIIVLVVILLAVTSDILNGGQLGLAITYAVQVTWSMNEVVWSILEMEMSSVAAERINEYMDLPSEADWTGGKVAPPLNWPETGIIEYDKYATRYRSGLELVLKGISFKINHGEKIGVVGRTGAGKSSLALSLFRIIESAVGDISIDGVRIADLGLHPLRTRITILPQDPVLFSGTLRMNIDPLGTFSDEEIWRAIDYAHLKNFVTSQSEGLMYDCGEAGQNLSVGQRQLVCLARTLLNKTKILILDEATAAVDMETDALIQLTIRSQFADCTILTIAHRLNTVMDYDRVMVLDQGRIKEFDEPRELLKNKEGIFHTMAKDAGLI